ncbi:NitT/TauT family transport system permease protein [Leucobacter luti]|uniref:ABC transporter permease n=1 Tax=Leucobacter luti TaxID=340320 RepID=UPI0010E80780|nr:ABC transporter permease subunit [Leucobacter luti]MCW2287668.1 NitT/TauT family transport system permease protein [Leucobacter luti]TCK46167.1 NitT/TauT family transport system permease protein [Leucobacter luti]
MRSQTARASHRMHNPMDAAEGVTPVTVSPIGPFSGYGPALRARDQRVADIAVLAGVAVLFWLLIVLTRGAATPVGPELAPAQVSTDPSQLPYYAGRSLLRMFLALAAATLFAFVVATAAARLPRAGRVIIPALDVLQSVPVLGFLSVTIGLWLTLFPGTSLGLEIAAIFAIFTSQVWNMTFAFYQSLITQPRDLDEASRMLRLSQWQRFWQLDAPHGAFPLVWNGMMSFGGGWFFLIASEVITVHHRTYALPGLGSYAAAAAARAEPSRLLLAAIVLIVLVVGVNFVFWRPLTAWAERFRAGDTDTAEPQRSVVFDLLRRSAVPGLLARLLHPVWEVLDRATRRRGSRRHPRAHRRRHRAADITITTLVTAVLAWGVIAMLSYISREAGLGQFATAAGLGLVTFARVLVLLVLSTVVWVPIGVWIGLNPRVTRVAQPIVQVLASFPANFLFPFAAIVLLSTGISLNWGGILLMSLGAQWYILFNVIAGAAAIPIDLREAAQSMRLTRAETWRELILPAVFGSWVTGALTAAGGAWNASIVAEVVSYGGETLTATGLGAYIAEATSHGDFGQVLVGVLVMSVYVVALNRLLWRRLYALAEQRFSFT